MKMKEIFSFPLEILDGPSGERNFEMYRAEKKHYIPAPLVDPNFDPMVRRLMEPFEINFEMIHMVSYMRKRVNPEEFDCMNSVVISAEFWLHRLAERSAIQPIADHPPALTSEVIETQSFTLKADESSRSQAETHQVKPHRDLPGFNTILQCGTTKLGESMFTAPHAQSVVYNTPTYGRIGQMFSETVTSPLRYQSSEVQYEAAIKENLPIRVVSDRTEEPMDDAQDSKQPSISLNVPEPNPAKNQNVTQWSPLVDTTNTAAPHGSQEKTEAQQKTGGHRMLFEIFHDSYLQGSAKKPQYQKSSIPASTIQSTSGNLPTSLHQSVTTVAKGTSSHREAPLASGQSAKQSVTQAAAAPGSFPNIDCMDDTAVFDLLDFHLAQAQRNSITSLRPNTGIPPAFSTDSPTRLFERLLGSPSTRTTPHK